MATVTAAISFDRARMSPGDPSSSVPRNAGRLPTEATVDLRVSRRFNPSGVAVEPIFEVFNLFNRANFTDVNNIFGTGAFPSAPLLTYGCPCAQRRPDRRSSASG